MAGLFTTLFAKNKQKEQIARLEAFLAAVPHEYCGFGADKTIAFSENFSSNLGLENITSIGDITAALEPSSGAALDTVFTALEDKNEPFCITVKRADNQKTFKLSGQAGHDTNQDSYFHVLWLEDITKQEEKKEKENQKREHIQGAHDRLELVLDKLSLPVWMRDYNQDIIWVNQSYASILNSTPSHVIADRKELPLRPVKKDKVKKRRLPQQIAKDALTNETTESERLYAVAGGNRLLMKVSEMPLLSSEMTLGFAQDITREEELETEHERYTTANKELLENLATAAGFFDTEQRLEFYNSAFGQLWHLDDHYLNTKPKLGDIMEKLRETRRQTQQRLLKGCPVFLSAQQ